MTVLRRIVKWTLLLVVAAALFVLACWTFWPDESLDPQVQQALDFVPSIPPQQNAYFMLLGLGASPDRDAFSVGQQKAAALEAAVRANKKFMVAEVDALDGDQAISKSFSQPWRCPEPTHWPCIQAWREQRAVLQAQIKAQANLLQRYRALRQYPHMESTVALSATLPYMLNWTLVMAASDMVDAQIVYDVEHTALRADALNELLQEVTLWRRAGSQGNLLVDRMVVRGILQRKLRLTSALLAEHPEWARQNQALVQKITQPLSVAEVGSRKVLEAETRFVLQIIKHMPNATAMASGDESSGVSAGLQHWFGNLSYRPNATLNEALVERQHISDFFSQTPAMIVAGQDEFEKAAPSIDALSASLLLYNPVGKVLNRVANGRNVHSGYVYRLYDQMALSRLLELQRQIAVAQLKPDQIAAFVQQAPPELRNPYTNQPMVVDEQAATLSFEAHSKSRDPAWPENEVRLGNQVGGMRSSKFAK